MKMFFAICLLVFLTNLENKLYAQISDSLLQFQPVYGNREDYQTPFTESTNPDSVYQIGIENPSQDDIDISVYKNLQSLSFYGNDSDFNFNTLPDLSKCKKINELSIYQTSVSEINPLDFPNLKKIYFDFVIVNWIEKLNNIELIDCYGIHPEVDLSKLKKLNKLILRGGFLPIAPQIKYLNFVMNAQKYKDQTNLKLENIAKYTELETLDLTGSNNLFPMPFFEAIGSLKKLKKIILPSNLILNPFLGLKNSQSITQVNVGLFDERVSMIPNLEILETYMDENSKFDIKSFPKLKKLIVHVSFFQKPYSSFLKDIQFVPEVELTLNKSMLEDSLFMNQLAKMKNVKTLNYDEAINEFKNIQLLYIEKLNIRNNSIQYDFLNPKFLSKFPNLKSIEIPICKYVSNFEITDYKSVNKLNEVVLKNDCGSKKVNELVRIKNLLEKNCPNLKVIVKPNQYGC